MQDSKKIKLLPFYDLGKKMKNPVTEEDIDQTIELLQRLKPHQIFAAGDFADPHGTHLVCFNIILKAMEKLRKTEDWARFAFQEMTIGNFG